MSDMMGMIVEALRGKKPGNPDNPKLHPLEQRREGYRLYTQEQKQMGEEALPYEEWIKQEEPIDPEKGNGS